MARRKRPKPHLSATKWPRAPNLRKRPPKPALGRGRVQRMVRRAFIAHDATELTTTELLDWAYGRRRPGSLPWGLYRSLYRACALHCVRVRRAEAIGRPWVWRLRNIEKD
jgi:hypothetical protein